MSFVWQEGRCIERAKAKISPFERGFLFGDGLYTTILVEEGQAVFLQRHLQKFKEQCTDFGLHLPLIEFSFVEELIKANNAHSGRWRLRIIVTSGESLMRGLPKGRRGDLLMLLEPFDHRQSEIRCALFPSLIITPFANYKTLAHLGRYYVMQYAQDRGMEDAITRDERGNLLECAFGNIFWVDKGVFHTPSKTLPLFYGLTIEIASEIAKELDLKIEHVEARLDEISENALCFRTNSLGGILPITQIESRSFSQDPSLSQAFVNHLYQTS